MSEFSEKLSQEIRRTNKPLRYLAEASGLQLDYISKMSRGKRIPQEEEKLKCLLDAMECVQRTKETLLRLYRQEKMGRARWGCMQELIRIIEQDDGANAGQEQRLPIQTAERDAIADREDIFLLVRKMLAEKEGKRLLIWTAAVTQEAMERLMQLIAGTAAGPVEHLFPLWQNLEEEDTLENLRRLRVVRPAVSLEGYHPRYYYLKNAGETSGGLFPNWFLAEDMALAVNEDMDCGIVLRESSQIGLLKTEFHKKSRMARDLVCRYSISEYMEKVNRMMNTGYVTRNYYIEQSPCLLHLIPLNILKEHLLIEGEGREALLRSIQLRTTHMQQEEMVHIFSVEGLRYLMEEGRITGYPDALYRPIDVPLRIWLLKRYYQYIQSTPHSCICVREDCVRLPRHMSIVSSSNVDNGMAFWSSTREGLSFYQLMEAGISRKLYELCRFLEEGNLTCTCGETLELIGQMIREYGGTL
ncbi:MAG TPA: hypothetical protein H9831_12615 [Candidatus Eisenbergiella pullistercoris]|uniref:XRE family transcriptional regulator n=1 Tax=Candidatus Eisenbergiella pullistercoris TaxID=2838555 RepID=A0A9D1YR44_9FIRM|nr:hypothetical protein [Candidatus Eisenbergiella pullistercoris]